MSLETEAWLHQHKQPEAIQYNLGALQTSNSLLTWIAFKQLSKTRKEQGKQRWGVDGEARGATKKQQIVKKYRMHNLLWSRTAMYCFKEAGCRKVLLFLNFSPFPFPSASKGIKEIYSNEHRNASSSVCGTVQTVLPP